MTVTKLIPAAIWASLPELDLEAGEDLFPQVAADTYRPVRADVASVVIPSITAGTINQINPVEGDILSVSGASVPAGATYQWQINQVDIASATGATLDTTGLSSGALRRGTSAGAQGPVFTPEVTLGAAANVPSGFQPSEWSIIDAGTGGDAVVTITALPDNGGFPVQIVQRSISGGDWRPIVGANKTGTYSLSDLFTDGSATDVRIRAVNQNGPGPASEIKTVTTSNTPGTPAPSASGFSAGTQGSDGTLQISISGLSGDAPDSYVVITSGAQSGLTSAQVRAGNNASGNPAASASAADLRMANLPTSIPLAPGLDGTYHGYVVLGGSQANYSDPITMGSFSLDTTAPNLSGALLSGAGTGTADWSVSSDKAAGTIYAAVREAALPQLTAAEIIAGSGDAIAQSQDSSPNIGGGNGGSFSGLTPATQYCADIVQRDDFGNESVVISSPPVTTNAPSPLAPQIVAHGLIDSDTALNGTNGTYFHEFTGVDFGAADPDRALSLLVLHKRANFGGSNGHDWSGTMIGGVVASIHSEADGNPGYSILTANVANGSNGTVRIDVGANQFAKGMAFVLLRHDRNADLTLLVAEEGISGTIDLSATVKSDSVLVAGAVTEGASAGAISWQGITAYDGPGYIDNASIVAGLATPRSFALASDVTAGPRSMSANFGGAPNSNKNAAFIVEIV
ncbi:MAG: fibronectin type III domain-containing protein [Pseudomonadota bacterium]